MNQAIKLLTNLMRVISQHMKINNIIREDLQCFDKQK